jgi:hypothetical protein
MSTRRKGKSIFKSERPEIATLDNEYWVWGVIFTVAALAALLVTMLFTVAMI